MSSAELRAQQRGPVLPAILVVGGLLVVCAAVATGRAEIPAAAILLLLAALALSYRFLSRWDVMVAVIVGVIMFIPIKRYQFAVSLPFDLEPYRILIGLVVALWIAALLVDRRVELQRTVLDGPLLVLALVVVASVVLNAGTIVGAGSPQSPLDISGNVVKDLLFLLSFFLLFYFITSVVRSPDEIHACLKTLVLGAGVVAFFAIIERRTGYNVFNHLHGWIPGLSFKGAIGATGISRGGRLRTYGPAQHPIALGAMLVMVVPLSIYLARQMGNRLWYLVTTLLLLGAVATVSRTSVMMLLAVGIVAVVLRRALVRPALIALLPALIAVHFVIPGAIGSLRESFFPRVGIVQDQTKFGGRVSAQRLDPQFKIIKDQPFFGQGYGTRITQGPQTNALVLDNQWLGTAVETGLIGVFTWVWIFVRFVRRAGRVAKRDRSGRGDLLTALAASVTAFSIGMLTYDAFSFIQVTVVMFILLALGASAIAYRGSWPEIPSLPPLSFDWILPSADRER